MADIEIQKFYEQFRSFKQKLAFLEQRVSTISALTSSQTLNSLDSERFNVHAGKGTVHYPKGAIELQDLANVVETSVADLELLSYDLTNLKWINRTQHEVIPETKFFVGTFIEKFHALVTSDGATITMTLTEVNAGDLTMLFSDGYTTLVTSGSITIALTAGASDAAPQANYIYILQSGKVLAKSTSAWPSAEHIKVGYFVVPTAGFVQTNNVYVNQNWNEGNDVQGHLSDMAQRMRQFGGRYFSGIDAAGTSDYLTIAAGNVEFKSTAGVVWQIHDHAFGAFDTSGGDLVLVKNWNGDSYHDITDLFDIVDDSAGVTLANKWFKMVIWGIGNKDGELDYIIINLPNSSYTTQAKATEDKNNSADYAIPRQYSIESSTGFLICEIVVKQAATWLYGSTKDLRGLPSASAVAGAVGTGITDHASLTGLAVDDHTQYMLDSVFGTITNTPDIDQDLLTTSSPTFVSPVIGTSLLPDASGGADIGSAALELGDMFIADAKEIKLGSDQDWSIGFVVGGTNRLEIVGNGVDYIHFNDIGEIFFDTGLSFQIRDSDDGDATLYKFDTTARLLELFSNADPGRVVMGGDGADDASLVLPYLTGAPGTLVNGTLWFENDGLHIYYNGAEKLVAGV